MEKKKKKNKFKKLFKWTKTWEKQWGVLFLRLLSFVRVFFLQPSNNIFQWALKVNYWAENCESDEKVDMKDKKKRKNEKKSVLRGEEWEGNNEGHASRDTRGQWSRVNGNIMTIGATSFLITIFSHVISTEGGRKGVKWRVTVTWSPSTVSRANEWDVHADSTNC